MRNISVVWLTSAIISFSTHPCNGLDSPDNLEQQFAEAPGWEVGSRVLDAQTQQVGSCQLMVISCRVEHKKKTLKKILSEYQSINMKQMTACQRHWLERKTH